MPVQPERVHRLERGAVFSVSAGLVCLYAFRGGTYDAVVLHETGIAIWTVLAVGLAAGVLPRSRPSHRSVAVLIGFAALAAWTALALGWTESDERTVLELGRVLHHAGVVLLTVCFLTRRTWTAAVAGVGAGAAIVCLVAVASRLFPDAFPSDPIRSAFATNRLSYPLNYWNAIAAWSTVTAVIGLALSLHPLRAVRVAALASMPVAVTAAYLTYSRQIIPAMVVGALLVWALSRGRAVVVLHAAVATGASALVIWLIRDSPQIAQAAGGAGGDTVAASLIGGIVVCGAAAWLTGVAGAQERLRIPRGPAIGLGVTAVAIAVVASALFLPPAISDAWRQFSGEGAPSASSDPAARFGSLHGNRGPLWESALRAYERDPVQGTGPGTFSFWWSRDGTNSEQVEDAHSVVLEALAETGWPGMAFQLAIIALLIGGAIVAHLRSAPAQAVVVGAATAATVVWFVHAAVDWMWESTANTAVVLLACGAALGHAAGDRPRVPMAGRLAAGVGCAAVALSMLPAAVSTSLVRESQRHVADDRLDAALAAATDAVASAPWAATPYLQRALVAERSGRLDAASADLERAIEREPTNWRHSIVVARVHARAGRPDRALAAWRRTRDLLRHPAFPP